MHFSARAGVCELECEWDTVKKHEGQAVLDTDSSYTFQIHRYCTARVYVAFKLCNSSIVVKRHSISQWRLKQLLLQCLQFRVHASIHFRFTSFVVLHLHLRCGRSSHFVNEFYDITELMRVPAISPDLIQSVGTKSHLLVSAACNLTGTSKHPQSMCHLLQQRHRVRIVDKTNRSTSVFKVWLFYCRNYGSLHRSTCGCCCFNQKILSSSYKQSVSP
jgi:hypothetical protein